MKQNIEFTNSILLHVKYEKPFQFTYIYFEFTHLFRIFHGLKYFPIGPSDTIRYILILIQQITPNTQLLNQQKQGKSQFDVSWYLMSQSDDIITLPPPPGRPAQARVPQMTKNN